MVAKSISVRKLSILLLLRAPDGRSRDARPIAGITRLQKVLFLLSQQLPVSPDKMLDFDMQFEANRFGPADLALYQDLDFLAALGHIRREPAKSREEQDLPPSYADASETNLTFEYLMADEELVGDYAFAERGPSETFAITEKGLHLLKNIEETLDARDRAVFDRLSQAAADVRRKYGDWPLEKLLRFVYERNPEMITASEIKERVLGNRG